MPSAPPPPAWNQPPGPPPAAWTPGVPNAGSQSPYTGWQSPYSETAYGPVTSNKATSVKVWLKRGAFVAAVVFGLSLVAAFRHEVSDPYSHAGQEAFVHGCKDGGGTDGSCRCAFAWIKQNVPAADYKAFDKLAASPNYTAAQTPPWIMQAANACRGR